MSDQSSQTFHSCPRRSFLFLFIVVFFLISEFGFANPVSAQSIGIRASFREGFLHVEWDAAPAGATDWRIRIHGLSNDLVNGNLLVCGPGIAGFGSCPFGIGTTAWEIDLAPPLLAGSLIRILPVLVLMEALDLDGDLIASGVFFANVPTPPILLQKASGDGQRGRVNTLLEAPLVVRLTRMGRPLRVSLASALNWSVTPPPGASGYRIEPSAAPVGPGETAVGFQLGDKEGEYRVRAACAYYCGEAGQESVTFTAHAIKELKLQIDAGDHQTGRIRTILPQMLAVRVTDVNGQAVSGEAITFRLLPESVEAGASLSVASTGTDGEGRAKTSFTLGKISGESYTLIATCEECTPQSVTFTENAARVNIELASDPAEVAPSGTTGNNVSLLTATVSDQFGSFPDYPLTFEREFEPRGHAHENPPLPDGMKGGFSPVSCLTDSGGRCSFSYTASEVAGTAKVVAKSAWEEENQSNTQNLTVRVSGLEALTASVIGSWRLTGGTGLHGNNHHGTVETNARIRAMATDYFETTGNTIGINDMSLVWGGVFDLCGTWNSSDTCLQAPKGGHNSHRIGKSVDIDREGVDQDVLDFRATHYIRRRICEPRCIPGSLIHYEFP